MSVRGFFGGLLIAIGWLIVLLVGGCAVIATNIPINLFNAGVFLAFSLPPLLIGGLMIFIGRAIRGPHKAGKGFISRFREKTPESLAEFWIRYFIIMGGISLLVFGIPNIIIFSGFFALIFPGIIFMFSQMLFVYPLAWLSFHLLMRPLGKIRLIIAPLIVLGVALWIPYMYNLKLYNQIKAQIKDDVDISAPVNIDGTIAFIYPVRGNGAYGCTSKCRNLLYNGTAKGVMIGYFDGLDFDGIREDQKNKTIKPFDKSEFSDFYKNKMSGSTNKPHVVKPNKNIKPAGKFGVVKYFIERRSTCPIYGNFPTSIRVRMAMGECLMQENASLADADMIYIFESTGNKRLTARGYHLEKTYIKIRRKLIVQKTGATYTTLYQKTEVSALPLFYPFMFGGKFGDNMGESYFSSGFYRSMFTINSFAIKSQPEQNKLFGGDDLYLRSKPSDSLDRVALIRQAITDSDADISAGHNLFPEYLREMSRRRATPTKSDVELVILALNDDRISDFPKLAYFNSRIENIPVALREAMANRILRTPNQARVVSALSDAIRELPSEMNEAIAPQLLQITKDRRLRGLAWKAVTRLSDGYEGALDEYIAIIGEWQALEREKKTEDVKIMPNNALAGALVGICYMGKDAIDAKDVLVELLRDDDARQYAVDALSSMGEWATTKQSIIESGTWDDQWGKVGKHSLRPHACGKKW